MRSPRVGKPRRSTSGSTLSRGLPKLRLPGSSLSSAARFGKPRVGRPPRSIFAGLRRPPR